MDRKPIGVMKRYSFPAINNNLSYSAVLSCGTIARLTKMRGK